MAPLPDPDLVLPSIKPDDTNGNAHFYRASTVRELTQLTQAEYLRHELLDRASSAQEIVDGLLGTHLSLAENENSGAFTPVQLFEIRKHIGQAQDGLSALYQYLGEICL